MQNNIYQGLYRSTDNKMLGGVCGGMAHRFTLSAGGLRLLFIILAICWIGLPAYVVLWILLRSVPTKHSNG